MCAGCHTLADAGRDGQALQPRPRSAGVDETHTRFTIAEGEPGMPGWRGVLSEREFEELVAYIVAVASTRRRRRLLARTADAARRRRELDAARTPSASKRTREGSGRIGEMKRRCATDRHVEWRPDAERARRSLLAAAAPPDRARTSRSTAAAAAGSGTSRPGCRRCCCSTTSARAAASDARARSSTRASATTTCSSPPRAATRDTRRGSTTCARIPTRRSRSAGTRLQVHAHVASDEERERLWPRCVATYAGFDDYQARAGRTIPLVVLSPRA